MSRPLGGIEDAARRLAVFGCWCRKMLVDEVVDVGAVPCLGKDGVDEDEGVGSGEFAGDR